jgi:hypothetical protein
MHEHGIAQPGFLSQRPDVAGRRAFKSTPNVRPALPKPRTGVPYQEAIHNRTLEAVRAQEIGEAKDLARHRARNEDLRMSATGHALSPEQGRRMAINLDETAEGKPTLLALALGEHVMVPYGPKQIVEKYQEDAIKSARSVLEENRLEEHTPFDEGILGHPDVRWGLIPRAILKRDEAAQAASFSNHPAAKVLQGLTSGWRQFQLRTKPAWAVGVGEENYGRGAVAGIGPHDVAFGKRGVESIERLSTHDDARYAQQAREMLVEVGKRGGQYDQAQALRLHLDGEDFVHTALEGPVSAVEHAGRLPAIKQAVAGWQRLGDAVLAGMSRVIEHPPRQGAWGQAALREWSRLQGSVKDAMVASNAAIDEFMKGQLSPGAAAHLLNEADRALGNYTHMTPVMRGLTQTIVPFAPWWINSLRWLGRMPWDHPLQTAILTSLEQGTRILREEQNANRAPWEADLVPLAGVGLDLARYSPLGATTGGTKGALETAAGLVGPNFVPPVEALLGAGAFGKSLKTVPERLGAFGGDLATYLPFGSQARQLAKPAHSLPENVLKVLSPVPFSWPAKGDAAKAAAAKAALAPAPSSGSSWNEYDYSKAGEAAGGGSNYSEYDYSKLGR